MSERQHAFIFAGGGTGGHIFPAIAIAEQLRAIDPDCTCLFVCSTRPLDSEILSKETFMIGASTSVRSMHDLSACALARYGALCRDGADHCVTHVRSFVNLRPLMPT